MNIIADVTFLQAITLFSVGFFGALIGGVASIFGGSKAKKAARIAADNAAKDRALQKQLADRAEAAQQKKQDWIMKLAMIGGGLVLLVVIIFVFKKKR